MIFQRRMRSIWPIFSEKKKDRTSRLESRFHEMAPGFSDALWQRLLSAIKTAQARLT
jgi:hypothetical protein